MKKVVLVTGSSRGIGKTTARLFAQKGYIVILHGRNSERLNQTKEEFIRDGFEVHAFTADVSNIEEVNALFSGIMKTCGRLDILITNASLTMEAEFMETDLQAFTTVVNSHIYGTIYPIQVMLDEVKANRGSIVMISSLAGLHGLPRFSAYCTGKMALTAFWQSLRLEQRNSGLHLALVHLAFVKNDAIKTLVNANGELETMPPRPGGLQQPQETVAKGIYRVVRNRKKRTVLSVYGKTFAFFARHLPGLLNFFLIRFFKY